MASMREEAWSLETLQDYGERITKLIEDFERTGEHKAANVKSLIRHGAEDSVVEP